MARKKRSFRWLVQVLWTALSNGFVYGFYKRQIYKGELKKICLPGLNCYSCPGAVGSCPIGALQGVITGWKFDFSFFVVGALIFFGSVLGRMICGFLCPFGLVQDVFYKIPFFAKRKSLPFHKVLVYLKYAILIVFVGILPITMTTYKTGTPAFCKYICPTGTLMGALALVPGNEEFSGGGEANAAVPVVGQGQLLTPAGNPGIGAALAPGGVQAPFMNKTPAETDYAGESMKVGALFYWKVGLLCAFLFLSVYIYRPFCKYVCPLGAVYSLFSRVALVRMKIDRDACVHCGMCKRVCKMSIDPEKTPNAAECIRCGDCIRACPKRALAYDTPFTSSIRKRRAHIGKGKTGSKDKGGIKEC